MSDATPHKPRKWLRRSALLLAGLALILGIVLGGLQSGTGKAYLLRVGGEQLESLAGVRMTAEGPAGFWPFQINIARLTLADAEGPFLTIDDLELQLSGAALLGGRVRLPLVAARQIALDRTPTLPPSDTPDETQSSGIPSFETWPTLPGWIQLDDLKIESLLVAEAVAGQALDLEIGGSLQAAGAPPLQLAVRAPAESTTATLEGRLQPENLDLALRIADRRLLGSFLGQAFEVDASLEVSGPVDALSIRLDSQADGSALLTLNGLLDMGNALGASLDATANLQNTALAEWIPAAYRDTLTISTPALTFRENTLHVTDLALALRPDAPVAEVLASLRYPLEGGAIEVDLSGNAPDINHFSPGLQETPLPVTLRLAGAGTLEQFPTTLNVMLDDQEAATGQVTLALAEAMAMDGELVLHPLAQIVGDAAEGVFEEGLRLNFAVQQESDVLYRVERLALRAASNAVDASGHVSTALDDIDLAVQIQAGRLADFAPLVPGPLSGAVDGAFRVTASADKMQAEGNLSLSELLVSDYTVARGDVTLNAEGGALADSALEGLTARLSGRFEEITSPQYTSPQISLELEAQPAENGDIVLSALSLSDGISDINGEGRFATDLADFSFVAKLDAEDLRPYVAASPVPPATRIQAELSAGRDNNGPITYNIDLGATAREDATEEVLALLREEATLQIAGTYHENRVVLDTLNLSSTAAVLNATAEYDLESGVLNATSTGNLPTLGAFAPFIEQTLSGVVDLEAEIAGNLDTGLTAKLALQGESVAFDTYRADTLRVALDASGLPESPTGTAEVEALLDGETLRSNVAFAQQERSMNVSALQLSLAENDLSGSASIHLDTFAIESSLRLDMPRLEAFAALLGQPISGALAGEMRVAKAGERIAVIGALEGSDIVFPPADLRVKAFQLNSDLNGALPALEGTLNLDATDAVVSTTTLDLARVELFGDGQQMRFSANFNGRAAQDYPLDIESAGAFMADFSEGRLDRLEGTVSVFPIALQSPLVVQAEAEGYSATPFEIQVGSGTIQGGGNVRSETVDAEISWQGFVLNELDELGLPSLQGATDGRVMLSGTVADPVLAIEATIADFYPGIAAEGEQVKTLQLALNGNLAGGSASGNLQVDAEDAFDGEANVSAPINFRLSPFVFEAAPDAPLNGQIVANGDMAALVDALALRDHLVEGTLDADFQLSGTVDAPMMTGEANWREGRYENSETSTIYENLVMTLTAEGRLIRLTQFEGTDPTGGTLQAEGQIDLDPEAMFPFRFEAQAGKTRIIHRDDLTAVADGVVTVAGTTERIEVTGDLTAGPATIVIPERIPPASMKVIDYEEVNREDADLPPQGAKEDEEGPAAGPEIILNIKVDMPNQVYVRAAALDSEWQGNLEIVGTAADPRIAGILRVVRGNADFLGRRFDLRTSTISFDRAVPPSPFVDVTAATQTREVTARVRARGEFDNLEITMESEPALPQDEVLAQVLFNRQLSEVSPLQAVQLAQAAAALRGGASGSRLLGGGSTVPGIDRLDFRQGATPGETAVGVGKNLGENVYVEVQQSVGAESSKVLVQVEVTPNFSVEAEAGASATSGAGAFYKKDY